MKDEARATNQKFLTVTHSHLSTLGLHDSFWAEILSTLCYLHNVTHGFIDCVPAEQWLGTPHDISHLRKLGCNIWVRHYSANQLLKGQLLGYMGQQGYRVFIPERQLFLFVKLHEAQFTPPPTPLNNYEEVIDDILPFSNPPLPPQKDNGDIADILPVRLASPSPPPVPPLSPPPSPPHAPFIPPRRSHRIPIPSQISRDHHATVQHEEEARKRGELWARDNKIDKREPEDRVQVHYITQPPTPQYPYTVTISPHC